MYDILPQMQKIVSCSTEKITLLEQVVADLENKIDEINKKLEDMDLKVQDFNIVDMLKGSSGGSGGQSGADGVLNIEGEEGNALILNIISNLEKKINSKSKSNDERMTKIEETNFSLAKEIQNLKNAQDGIRRHMKSLNQTTEDIILNLKNMENSIKQVSPDIAKNIDIKVKTVQKKEPEELDDSSRKEDKENREKIESVISLSRTEQQLDLENNEKIKEMSKKIENLEKAVKSMPNYLGIEQMKSDINALKSNIGNCALAQDLKDVKEKGDETQRQLSVLKDQFEDFITNTADHDDLQNLKRKLEFVNSKVQEYFTTQEELVNKITQSNINKSQYPPGEKYVEIQRFEDFKAQIIKEFTSVNDNFTHLRRLVDSILDSLKNKPSYRDIKVLEEELLVKIEELKVATAKKFAERIETTKNFKYLDQQIKNILQVYISKDGRTDNWLLAKRPLNSNLCASCEAYIGDLKDNSNFPPWNTRYPHKDQNDKYYRLGNGFSKMLQMLNVDENEKKNASNIQKTINANNSEINLANKLNENNTSKSNLSIIKTEINNENNNNILPKIKGNNTSNNFMKNNNSNNKNITSGNNTENVEEQNIINEGNNEKDARPKITKISKVNKD